MDNYSNANRETDQEISLIEIFNILKKNIGVIISTSLIGIVVAAIFTFIVIDPTYSSTTDLVVNDQQESNAGQQLDQAVLQTSFTLLNTYTNIIEKPIVLQPVIEKLKLDMTVKELADMTTMSTESDSLVFSIAVESESPYLAADLANGIAESFSNEITNILNVNNVTILTVAEPELNPVSPRPILNLGLGALLGLMAGIGWAFVKFIFDRSVRNEDIITEIGWTLLGSIPEMSQTALNDTRFQSVAQPSNSASKRRRI